MVKKEIKSIILYLDSAVAIDYLTDEQAGILFKAVLRYGRNGHMLESSDTALTALFTMLCTQIDRDHKKYEERCERNVTNAMNHGDRLHDSSTQILISQIMALSQHFCRHWARPRAWDTDQSLCERNEKQGFPNRGTLAF